MHNLPGDYEAARYSDDQWTDGGGGDSSEPSATTTNTAPALNAEAIKVGDDQWNKDAAVRLETEYQTVKPELEAIATEGVGEHVDGHEDDEDEDAPFVPNEWDTMSGDQQQEAKDDYVQHNKSSYIDSEIDHWHESGNALDDAKSSLAYAYEKKAMPDWFEETIAEYREEREENGKPAIPYSDYQLFGAISIDYQSGYEGNGKLTIDFDDDKLMHPSTLVEGQLDLPGIEVPVASAALSIECVIDASVLEHRPTSAAPPSAKISNITKPSVCRPACARLAPRRDRRRRSHWRGCHVTQADPLAAVAIPDATGLAAVATAVAARLKGVAAPCFGDGGGGDHGVFHGPDIGAGVRCRGRALRTSQSDRKNFPIHMT